MSDIRATSLGLSRALNHLLGDLSILAGDVVGPSGVSWQDVAGTAAVNARHLAALLEAARKGDHEGLLVFPSPAEALEVEG